MKYYFVTIQAKNKYGDKSLWNLAIDISPMQYSLDSKKSEEDREGGPFYTNFIILNTLEITKEEYEKYCLEF